MLFGHLLDVLGFQLQIQKELELSGLVLRQQAAFFQFARFEVEPLGRETVKLFFLGLDDALETHVLLERLLDFTAPVATVENLIEQVLNLP